MHALEEALVKYETIKKEQLQDVMDENPVREPLNWQNNLTKTKQKAEENFKETEAKQEEFKLDEKNEGIASADDTSTSTH